MESRVTRRVSSLLLCSQALIVITSFLFMYFQHISTFPSAFPRILELARCRRRTSMSHVHRITNLVTWSISCKPSGTHPSMVPLLKRDCRVQGSVFVGLCGLRWQETRNNLSKRNVLTWDIFLFPSDMDLATFPPEKVRSVVIPPSETCLSVLFLAYGTAGRLHCTGNSCEDMKI